MSHKYRDKIAETAEEIAKVLKEVDEPESRTTYILIETKMIQGLSSGLGDAILKVEDEAAKEVLLQVKAGLDWLVENESFPLNEVVKREKQKMAEKRNSAQKRKANNPWA